MKRLTAVVLGAALALLAVPAIGRADVTNQAFDQRSPLKYVVLEAKVGATSSQTGIVLGGIPSAGRIVDIQLVQAATGTSGTSWSATVKKNGTSVCTTDAVMALASGANKFLTSSTSPDVGNNLQETLPSGATRAVIKTDGTATAARGDVLTVDITNSGAYSPAFSGQVRVLIDPAY